MAKTQQPEQTPKAPESPEVQPAAELTPEFPKVNLGDKVRYVLNVHSTNAGQVRLAEVVAVRPDGVGLHVKIGHKNDFKIGDRTLSVAFGQVNVPVPIQFLDSAAYSAEKLPGTWHRATD